MRSSRHVPYRQVYCNQKEIAPAIAESGVDRKDIFITVRPPVKHGRDSTSSGTDTTVCDRPQSKLWNSQHRPDLVEPALDDTLKELGLDYLDLYLIQCVTALIRDARDP